MGCPAAGLRFGPPPGKIALIDTTGDAAMRYGHPGPFTVVPLVAPFSTDSYREAISQCEKADKQVIIIDNLPPEWTAEGGIIAQYKANYGSRRGGERIMTFYLVMRCLSETSIKALPISLPLFRKKTVLFTSSLFTSIIS